MTVAEQIALMFDGRGEYGGKALKELGAAVNRASNGVLVGRLALGIYDRKKGKMLFEYFFTKPRCQIFPQYEYKATIVYSLKTGKTSVFGLHTEQPHYNSDIARGVSLAMTKEL